MSKVLLFLVAVGVLIAIARYRAKDRTPPPQAPPVPPSQPHFTQDSAEPQAMVRCAVCGTYVPESESVIESGAHYCCEAHRQRAKSR